MRHPSGRVQGGIQVQAHHASVVPAPLRALVVALCTDCPGSDLFVKNPGNADMINLLAIVSLCCCCCATRGCSGATRAPRTLPCCLQPALPHPRAASYLVFGGLSCCELAGQLSSVYLS